MNITSEEREKIIDFLTPAFSFIINENYQEIDEESWDEFYNKLPRFFDGRLCFSDCGATKGVLIPEEKNYVIKIPFIRNDTICGCNFCGCSNEDEEDEGFWDYCEREVDLFKKATELKIDYFFCDIIWLADICGWPVYVQKRATPFRKNKKCYSDEEIKSFSKTLSSNVKIPYYPLNIGWAFEAYTLYGRHDFLKLLVFLRKFDILDDLHIGNIGYFSDKPCIFDFSGYYEE